MVHTFGFNVQSHLLVDAAKAFHNDIVVVVTIEQGYQTFWCLQENSSHFLVTFGCRPSTPIIRWRRRSCRCCGRISNIHMGAGGRIEGGGARIDFNACSKILLQMDRFAEQNSDGTARIVPGYCAGRAAQEYWDDFTVCMCCAETTVKIFGEKEIRLHFEYSEILFYF